MSRLPDLIAAVASLESEARRLVATAAQEGRFDDVAQLGPLAKDIAELAGRWSGSPLVSGIVSADAMLGEVATETTQRNGAIRGAGSQKKQYPQFVRERDDLIKLGWSARDKTTYEHRVPKSALDIIARGVNSKGKTGQRFSMDELLEAVDARDKEDIPSYQAYAAVSWLKQNGLLLQHGRQGYTVVRPRTFLDSVQTAWQALKRR